MPLKTNKYNLSDLVEEYREEREETADNVAGMDEGSPAMGDLVDRGQTLDRYISGLSWYIEEYETQEVELGALTNGERNRVRQVANEVGVSGVQQNAYVAMGTITGGYLKHDPGGIQMDEFKETTARVGDLHPAFVDWAESEITELGRMGSGMGNSFRDLVAEKRTQTNSPNQNG